MGNYSLTAIFTKEPAAIAGAIRAVLWLLVLLGVVDLVDDQLAALALALEVVLTLFVRQTSTSASHPVLPEGTPVTSPGTGDQPPPDLVVAKVEDVR